MDTMVVLWKSNQLSEKRTYKNVFNSFPKQCMIGENRKYSNAKYSIDNTNGNKEISEELSSFFQKMVSQLSIVTKTVSQFDEKLNKIEDFLERIKDNIMNIDNMSIEDSKEKKIELIRNEYNCLLDGYRQSKNEIVGVVEDCFKYSACFNKKDKVDC